MKDSYGREIDYLRISLNDNCNFACHYCIADPPPGVPGEERMGQGSMERWTVGGVSHRLTLSQMNLLAEAAKRLGFCRIRLTGGEPLLHPEVLQMVERLSVGMGEAVKDISMTTNASLLPGKCAALKAAGLSRLNISLDTLDPEVFRQITGRDMLSRVLAGIDEALECGFSVHLNAVLLPETDWRRLCEFAGEKKTALRFIQRMPFGNRKTQGAALTPGELRQKLEEAYGAGVSCREPGNGPAGYVKYPGLGAPIGVIAALSGKFCDTCNRVRITSDFHIRPCLCFAEEVDLTSAGEDPDQLCERMSRAIAAKPKEHCFDRCLDSQAPANRWQSLERIGG